MSNFFHHFWVMGGYGLYIWSAYVGVLVMLAINIVLPCRQRKQLIHELKTVLFQSHELHS